MTHMQAVIAFPISRSIPDQEIYKVWGQWGHSQATAQFP